MQLKVKEVISSQAAPEGPRMASFPVWFYGFPGEADEVQTCPPTGQDVPVGVGEGMESWCHRIIESES